MRNKVLFLAMLLLTLSKVSHAQDKGLTILLGPLVNVYFGDPQDKFVYTTERLSWQANGQLGFISTRGGTNRGNMLGVFASYGNSNPAMIALMKTKGAELSGDLNTDKKFNQFYTLEGGMVIARFLRISGGIGRQYYTYDSDLNGVLNYFSGTVGVVFNLDVVNWVIDANLMTGKDLNQNAVKLSTGFLVKF